MKIIVEIDAMQVASQPPSRRKHDNNLEIIEKQIIDEITIISKGDKSTMYIHKRTVTYVYYVAHNYP